MILINKKNSRKKLTTEEFVERSRSIHGDKYQYDKVFYKNAKSKVTIDCPIHGIFVQFAHSHLQGAGCRACSNERQSIERSRGINDFVKAARLIHGDTYLYDKVEYKNSNNKVTITCREHGDFEQVSGAHLRGQRCFKCVAGGKLSREEVIRRAREVHGDTYLYDNLKYKDSDSKIIITCRVHGNFEQKFYAHLRGDGCSKCSLSKKSKIANKWLDSLGIAEEYREVSLTEFPHRHLDAYDSITNTAYQFHGDYWHGNPAKYDSSKINAHNKKSMGELYERTLEWDQQIRDLGYNLVVMWEDEFKNHLSR